MQGERRTARSGLGTLRRKQLLGPVVVDVQRGGKESFDRRRQAIVGLIGNGPRLDEVGHGRSIGDQGNLGLLFFRELILVERLGIVDILSFFVLETRKRVSSKKRGRVERRTGTTNLSLAGRFPLAFLDGLRGLEGEDSSSSELTSSMTICLAGRDSAGSRGASRRRLPGEVVASLLLEGGSKKGC